MERQPRKRYSGEQIIGIIKRHLVEGVPVSDVCEQAGIHPTQFYRWQKQLFEVGASVFDRKPGRAESREVEAARGKVEELEKRLQKKHEVLSELMEEHVALKVRPETLICSGTPRQVGRCPLRSARRAEPQRGSRWSARLDERP